MNAVRRVVALGTIGAVVAAVWVAGERGGSTATASVDARPATLSVEEFCASFADLATSTSKLIESAPDASVSTLRDRAASLGELGPRVADMPDDVGAGLAYVVAALSALPDDATAEDVARADASATVTDEARADALIAYLDRECSPSAP